MPNYRRLLVPGGSYFFTVVTHGRRRFLTDPLARAALHEAIATVQRWQPFAMPAIVLLPNHLHTIWTLPPGDAGNSGRWRLIKAEFTDRYLKRGGVEGPRSPSRIKRKERGIWQRRYGGISYAMKRTWNSISITFTTIR
jgi:putative transposase